ncbi:MAG: phage antirepressor [Treponema sp.]|nr:phage antirepressor [Treponema sp.]
MNENKIEIFRNEEFGTVRTLTIDGEPYFVAKDVAEILGYSAPRNAISKHVDIEDKKDAPIQCVLGGTQLMTLINESGLYSLILSSKLPNAKKFKHWVTSEVLPSIRKHGAYMTPETLEQALTSPDFLIKLATELKTEKEKRQALEVQAEENKPKVLFADAVSVSNTSILVGDLAKIIKQNGVNIGANRLFAWLRDNGYLIKRKGNDYNMLTQYSMDLKLFEVKETVITHSDGHTSISKTPKVTGKGQQYFVNKFLAC